MGKLLFLAIPAFCKPISTLKWLKKKALGSNIFLANVMAQVFVLVLDVTRIVEETFQSAQLYDFFQKSKCFLERIIFSFQRQSALS